jgi:hypothetical protein
VWEGSLGPEDFDEPVYHFPVETKRDFTKECPLRGYDNRKEEWPKCRHGEDCLVQMFVEGLDGGRRFFKCPRAEVTGFNFCYSIFFSIILHLIGVTNCMFNEIFEMQCSESKENCGFTRWVDPRPIYPHAQYIYYLQDRIFELEREVSNGYKDEEPDDASSGAVSQDGPCHDPYCSCPNHKNNGPPPPPPPPPPSNMGGYYGEGATQFAMWPHY